ncbi:phage neck terminator protein [Serratia aquatilis]|uniref:Phage neck terminator protein gp12-like domain-containing protein n=1 Tax=Serratia aquatilis TaxID=1737515 RepID=A0ABV6EI51_9GAMM
MNNSTEPGYLTPRQSLQLDDLALEQLLSRWVCGVSGLPAASVLLRWLPEQPPQPAADVDWCDLGVMTLTTDAAPALVNQSDDSVALWRHDGVEVEISFYGPNGQHFARLFRDGLTLPQNNAELNAAGLSCESYGAVVSAPKLVKDQWVRRYDLKVQLHRKEIREYGVKSLVAAPVKFFGD